MTILNLLVLLLASNVLHAQECLDEPSPSNDPGEPLFLTPYIENGDIKTARSLSRVGKLPNAPHVPHILSYSGLFTVNEEYDSNMFFWFFPAMNHDKNAPIILWLEGGPGATCLISLFDLHGPYVVRKDQTVELRKYPWAKEYPIIYVDNPVGTGFSFTRSEDGYSKNEDQIAENLYEFLRQFFIVFHEYAAHDLYIIGESYGGKYVPATAYKIHMTGPPAQIKFKGIAIGNGVCDPETQMNYSDFYYQLGLVDRNQAEVIRNLSAKVVENIRNENYMQAVTYFNSIVADDPSSADPNYLLKFTGYNYNHNLLETKEPEDLSYYLKYIQLPEFRKAVHIGNLTFNDPDGKVISYLVQDIMQSIKPQLIPIMNNYRVLFYNGQLDLSWPYPQMGDMLSSIKFKYSDEFKNADRKVWKLNNTDEVAGYVHNIENQFYFVLVRNAGHIVPYYQPAFAYDMVKRFINVVPFA